MDVVSPTMHVTLTIQLNHHLLLSVTKESLLRLPYWVHIVQELPMTSWVRAVSSVGQGPYSYGKNIGFTKVNRVSVTMT